MYGSLVYIRARYVYITRTIRGELSANIRRSDASARGREGAILRNYERLRRVLLREHGASSTVCHWVSDDREHRERARVGVCVCEYINMEIV